MASQNCFLCSSDFGNLPLMVTTICRHIGLQNCFNNWVKDRTSCSVCHLPVMFENLPPFCALGAYPRHTCNIHHNCKIFQILLQCHSIIIIRGMIPQPLMSIELQTILRLGNPSFEGKHRKYMKCWFSERLNELSLCLCLSLTDLVSPIIQMAQMNFLMRKE